MDTFELEHEHLQHNECTQKKVHTESEKVNRIKKSVKTKYDKEFINNIGLYNLQDKPLIYSALHKYWNSKDKIALLAVESRYLQIW